MATGEEKIRQLEARLQKERAKVKAAARKERDGQLVAFGVYLETSMLNNPNLNWVQSTEAAMKKLLHGHTLNRALAGVRRVAEEIIKREQEKSKSAPATSTPAQKQGAAHPSKNPTITIQAQK